MTILSTTFHRIASVTFLTVLFLAPSSGFASATSSAPATAPASNSGFDHTHASWDAMIKKHMTTDGFVHYKAWKGDQASLDKYLSALTGVSESSYNSFTPDQKKAFLINAYNAYTVKLVLKHYPVKSIKDIGGLFSKPWGIKFFKLLGGKIQTLDEIEHEWLRKKKELFDARVHAAVNCASWSCPKLRREAFVATKLDMQLTESTREWLADPKRNKFNPGKKTAEVSKIFDWFDEDFGGNDKGIAAFIIKYGPPEAQQALSGDFDIDYMDYSWKLNEAKGSKS